MSGCLCVWREGEQVGELWLAEEGHAIGFTYASQVKTAISCSLPMSAVSFPPESGVGHRWFANLLPEEAAREALVRRLGVADDDFSLLEAIGGDCAGALQLLPPGQVPAANNALVSPVDSAQLARWAEGRERFALLDIGAGQVARLSLAGAQDKIPVVISNHTGSIVLPVGSTPSTHLIKFASKPALILNELYVNRLAALAGLPVPDCQLGRAGKGLYLLVERYDRVRDDQGCVHRLHQEDFCQALGLPRRLKYQEDSGITLGACAALLRRVAVSPAIAVRQLLHWQIMNVLVGNCDGHAKNLSLLQDAAGHWSLAPCYDLLCTLVLPYSKHMGFAVGNNYHPQQLTQKDWVALASAMGVAAPFVLRELRAMIETLQPLVNSDTLHSMMLNAGMEEAEWAGLQHIRKLVIQQCQRLQGCV